MKTPILATAGVLVLAVSAWCVKHSIDTRAAVTAAAPLIAEPASDTIELQDTSSENLLPTRNETLAKSAPADVPTAEAVSYGMPQKTLPASQSPLSSTPVRNPTQSNESQRSNFLLSAGSPVRPASALSSGELSQTAVSSNGNSAASDPGTLELDPGVPAPAALMPPPGGQSPEASAAQQQLADSFVRDANAAINQPGTSDVAASQSYYNALDRANEQYRSLYGNDSYNQQAMRATVEAQGGN